MGKIEIAQGVRRENIIASRNDLAKTVAKIDAVRAKVPQTVTQACRDAGVSTERYYRFKRVPES